MANLRQTLLEGFFWLNLSNFFKFRNFWENDKLLRAVFQLFSTPVMKFNENRPWSLLNGSSGLSHLFQLTVPSVFALLFSDV